MNWENFILGRFACYKRRHNELDENHTNQFKRGGKSLYNQAIISQ